MSIRRQLREASAGCLTALQGYHDVKPTAAAKARMIAEVEAVLGALMEIGLPQGIAEAGLLAPLETHLVAHYGPEVGRRLYGDFVEAAEAMRMSDLAMIHCS